MSNKERILMIITFSISFLAIFLNLFWDALKMNPPLPYNLVVGVIFVAFTLLHGKHFIGLKNIFIFFVITSVVSLIMEHYGVVTGKIYGEYHYGDIHGWKIFGTVPILIPLSWFLFIYPSIIITNELLGIGHNRHISTRPAKMTLIVAFFIDALITTALDILVDPIWVSRGSWFWTEVKTLPPERIFYGIPVQNYFGWLITTLIIFGIFRFYYHVVLPPQREEKPFSQGGILYYLPVFTYIGIFIVGSIESYWLLNNTGIIFTSIMTMGMVSLIMIHRIVVANQIGEKKGIGAAF